MDLYENLKAVGHIGTWKKHRLNMWKKWDVSRTMGFEQQKN